MPSFMSRWKERLKAPERRQQNAYSTRQNGHNIPYPVHYAYYDPSSVARGFAAVNPAELEASSPRTVPAHIIPLAPPTREQPAPQRLSKRSPLEIKADQERAKAEERRFKKKQNASAKNVRYLRQLIREKYRLDVYVWSHRGVQPAMRHAIEQQAWKADAILQEIIFIVNDWDEDLFNREEWKMVKIMKEQFNTEDNPQLLWRDLPPWDARRERRWSEDSWER